MTGVAPRTSKPAAVAARSRPSARIDLAIGWDALDALAPDWERLFVQHPRPVPWSSPAGLRALRTTWTDAREPLAATVSQNGLVRLILPLELLRRGPVFTVRGLGRGAFHRFEPLVGADAALYPPGEVLRGVVRRLRRPVLFDVAGLWPEAPGARWLAETVNDAAGWFPSEGALDFEVPLEPSWPAEHAAIRRSFRDRAARGAERARADGGLATTIFRAEAAEDLAFLFDLVRRRGRFLEGRAGRAIARLAEESAGTGRLLLGRTVLAGRPVAGVALWIGRSQAIELLAAHDPQAEALAPDAALRIEAIRVLVEQEKVRSLVMPPGQKPDAAGLCAAPRRQMRLWGAPVSGTVRLAARLAAWYGRENSAVPGMVRTFMNMTRGWGGSARRAFRR